MLFRPAVFAFALSALLGSCAYFSDDNAGSYPLASGLPPANMPSYAQGDRYTYDNPKETWTVTGITDNLLQWTSSFGANQVTVFDPLMPPVEWTRADGKTSTRKILEWSGHMFPLKVGNRLTFAELVREGDDKTPTRFDWRCSVEDTRQVVVPAGQFAVYPVNCARNDGFGASGYYAPAINRSVAITYAEADGWKTTRKLLSYASGNGERIAAKSQESLPYGWSEAAVQRSTLDVATRGRKKPTPSKAATTVRAPATDTPSVAVKADALNVRRKAAAPDRRYLIQLSSLASPISARKEWARLQKSFPSYFGHRNLVMEKRVIAGRGTFYRVQTGRYRTLKEARVLCNELRAIRQDCFAIRR